MTGRKGETFYIANLKEHPAWVAKAVDDHQAAQFEGRGRHGRNRQRSGHVGKSPLRYVT